MVFSDVLKGRLLDVNETKALVLEKRIIGARETSRGAFLGAETQAFHVSFHCGRSPAP